MRKEVLSKNGGRMKWIEEGNCKKLMRKSEESIEGVKILKEMNEKKWGKIGIGD